MSYVLKSEPNPVLRNLIFIFYSGWSRCYNKRMMCRIQKQTQGAGALWVNTQYLVGCESWIRGLLLYEMTHVLGKSYIAVKVRDVGWG